MLADIQEDIVLYDWLTFTSKKHDPEQLISILGLDTCSWLEGNGRHGYKQGLHFGHISVYFDGREDMGVCVDMSGQGCRDFESHSSLPGKWNDLFSFILKNNLHITRLDVACDDHTGLLDIDRVCQDTRNWHWAGRFRRAKMDSDGDRSAGTWSNGVRFGTRQSMILVRIYNKALERGYTDGRHWIRCEIQLKDERAAVFTSLLFGDSSTYTVGEAFCGVLAYNLRFLEPSSTDSNIRRWKTVDYWENFLAGASKIRLASTPGDEYNEQQLRHAVTDMWGNAIDCALQIWGERNFLDMIKGRTCRPNKKYEIIINKHFSRLEQLAAEMEERMERESALVEVEPHVFVHRDYAKDWAHWSAIHNNRPQSHVPVFPDWVLDAEFAPPATWLPPLEVSI